MDNNLFYWVQSDLFLFDSEVTHKNLVKKFFYTQLEASTLPGPCSFLLPYLLLPCNAGTKSYNSLVNMLFMNILYSIYCLLDTWIDIDRHQLFILCNIYASKSTWPLILSNTFQGISCRYLKFVNLIMNKESIVFDIDCKCGSCHVFSRKTNFISPLQPMHND